MTTVFTPHHQLWDIAGVDGLQVARALFGEAIDRISPFQSLEALLQDQPCSVLRLCEGNFRVAWQSDSPTTFAQIAHPAQQDKRVWVKQFPWLGAIAVPESARLTRLFELAVPKPPHRLIGIQPDCAAPARIDGISVLVWRHVVADQPAFELHAATKDLDTVRAKIAASA